MTKGTQRQTRQLYSLRTRFQHRLAGAWDILLDTIRNYQINGDVNQAAAIALYAILSFIPLFVLTILMVGSIFGSNPDVQNQLVDGIKQFHPYFSGDLITQLGKIDQKRQLLGWVGIISLIWFSSMIFGAIETALNAIFRSRKIRNYFVSKILAIAMIPMGWAIGVASVGLTYIATLVASQPVLAENVFEYLPFIHGVLFPYILPYLVTVVFFTVVYKVIPTAKVSIGHAIVGGAIFSALMELAKHFFTWYVSNYTRYSVIFGSLETVVILVIWVFYVALILLFCAELIASYQRRDLILLEKLLLKPDKGRMRVEERFFRKFGRMYPQGEYIFREGDTGLEIYYVLMGRIRLEKKAGQVKKVLTELGPGEYFGEMAALIDVPRTASALALEDSDVAAIDRSTLHRLLRESDEVSLMMLKEFSQRIRHTNTDLDELSQSWVRLMIILYFLREWPLPLDHDPMWDLAKLTHKDPQELMDVLAALSSLGILTLADGAVTGFDKERVWALLNEQSPL